MQDRLYVLIDVWQMYVCSLLYTQYMHPCLGKRLYPSVASMHILLVYSHYGQIVTNEMLQRQATWAQVNSNICCARFACRSLRGGASLMYNATSYKRVDSPYMP